MQMKLGWLVVALMLGRVVASADEVVPAKAEAKAATQGESWIPHGPELPLMADFQARHAAFLKRMLVEPWKKNGGGEKERAFLEMFCDWAAKHGEISFSTLEGPAREIRDNTQDPYVRALAFAWYADKPNFNTQAGQAAEKYYGEMIEAEKAGKPPMTEMAKAILAARCVRLRVELNEFIDGPICRRWMDRTTAHLLAAWEKKEFTEADQPFILEIAEMLPGKSRPVGSAKTLLGLVRGIEGKEANYPWLALMLQSQHAFYCGWDSQATDQESSVGAAGGGKDEDSSRRADRLLRQAWKLKPEWPEAAIKIMTIGLEASFPKNESVNFWFTQIVQNRFDEPSHYSALIWHLRPRWGGSLEEMLAFGDACFNTRRFDTIVPFYYLVALNEVATEYPYYLFRTPFRKDGVNAKINELYEEHLKHVKSPEARNPLIAQQVCANAWCGNHEKAKELLAKLPPDYQFYDVFSVPAPVTARWQLWSRREVEDEIEAYTTGPFKERLKEMSQVLYQDSKKGVELAAALAKAAQAAKDPRTQRIAMDVAGWALYPTTKGTSPASGWPVIHVAMMQKKPALVKQLVEMGEDPDRRGSPLVGYRTPLAYAFLTRNPEMVRLLVELGADPFLETVSDRPQNPIFDAIGAQDMVGIKALVDAGLKLKEKKAFCRNYLRWSWIARRGGGLPLQEYVFNNKLIDPNMIVWEDTGKTLLLDAATDGTLDEVRFLLKHGADGAAKDKDGRTPAELAKDPQIREFLLQGFAKEQEEEKRRQAAVWLKKYDFNGNGVLDPEERARAEKESQAGIQAPANDE